MSFYSRIQYNGINIDFDRGLSAFTPFPIQVKNVVRSRAGIAQTLNFYQYWNMSIGRLFASADLKNQIMAFWDYVRDGGTFSFWHDRDLKGYWNFENVYTDIDENNATFTRASAPFYDNPATGLLKQVNNNIARFPAGKFGRGLLMERAATNILTKSTEFNDAIWNATNFTVTTNYDADGAPAETPYNNGAEKLELTSTSGSLQYSDVGTNIGITNGVFSVYLRTHEPGTKSGTLYIKRADTDATLASTGITITPFWTRFHIPYTNAGSITANWRVRIEISGTSGDEFAIWGAQFEAAADLQKPSTFIYTTTASAARSADVLEFDAPDFFDNEQPKGSICFWYAVHPAGNANDNRSLIMVEADSGHVLQIAHLGGGLIDVLMGQLSGANISFTSTDPFGSSDGVFHHFAFTWDSTISNGLKAYADGVLIGTSVNSKFAIARVGADFYLGGDVADLGANGIFDDLEIRRDVLTAQDIAARARGNYSIGYDRNYFPSLMIDEQALGLTHLPGLPNWDLEIPVREAL